MEKTRYDKELNKIDHYIKYHQMLPWIGIHYEHEKVRLLTVGESHYLSRGSTYHLNASDWYNGISITGKGDEDGINTRNVLSRAIEGNWKKKSYTIFKNTEDALFSSQLFSSKPKSAYNHIAFMNYFQRPAQRTGESIIIEKQDEIVAREVFLKVLGIIKPTAIVFTSTLAYNNAKKNGVLETLKLWNISFTKCPHPATSWWNRESKKYGNKTGRNHFISFINEQINL